MSTPVYFFSCKGRRRPRIARRGRLPSIFARGPFLLCEFGAQADAWASGDSACPLPLSFCGRSRFFAWKIPTFLFASEFDLLIPLLTTSAEGVPFVAPDSEKSRLMAEMTAFPALHGSAARIQPLLYTYRSPGRTDRQTSRKSLLTSGSSGVPAPSPGCLPAPRRNGCDAQCQRLATDRSIVTYYFLMPWRLSQSQTTPLHRF
jgi:hypothetical protein